MMQILPYLLVFGLGLLAGGVVNFVIDGLYIWRKAHDEEVVAAMQTLGWGKYLFFPWLCSVCTKSQKLRVTFVNLFYGALAIWLFFSPPGGERLWWHLPLLIYFGVVLVIDIEYRVILEPVSLFGGLLGLVIGIGLSGISATLIGGLFGYAATYLIYKGGELLVQYLARRRGEEIEDAFGFGDVYLMAIIGLLLGWPGVIVGLVFSILAGGTFSFFFLIYRFLSKKYQAFEAIPFAPFLIFGAVALLYF